AHARRKLTPAASAAGPRSGSRADGLRPLRREQKRREDASIGCGKFRRRRRGTGLSRERAMTVTIEDIRAAAALLEGHVVRTPAVRAGRLAEMLGAAEVVLKLENQQYTGSFKDRGALNKLRGLSA